MSCSCDGNPETMTGTGHPDSDVRHISVRQQSADFVCRIETVGGFRKLGDRLDAALAKPKYKPCAGAQHAPKLMKLLGRRGPEVDRVNCEGRIEGTRRPRQ